MILNFRHKGLERFHSHAEMKGLPAQYMNKIGRVMFALENASSPEELTLPGFGLHRLSGKLDGYWSIVISRNWRMTFRFEGPNAADVDFADYH